MQGIEVWFRDLLITSETQFSQTDDLNFVGGGLFLESSLPPSFVSLISCSIRNDSIGISSWFNSASRFCCSYNNVSLRKPDFVKREKKKKKKRGDLDGFLSMSLSIKGSGELTGSDRDNKNFEEEEEVGYENDDAFNRENKEKLQGSGAFNTTKHLWSGAVAAMVSRTIVAPLERLKLEYIVLGEQSHLFELIKTIATNQGLKGFWKGNFVNILRTAPFKAVNFYAYDTYRKELLKISGNEETTNFEKFLAGAAAGITATVLCLPMDTIRTKMVAPGGEALGGVIGAFSHMIRTEGFFSLYKGLVPSILSVAPSGAVFYGVYDILKSAYLHSPEGRKRIQQMNEEGQELNAFEQMELGPMRILLYGAIAGTCAEAATYPFEVVRRQLQMQVQATKLSALATCAQIVEQRGIAALYAGLTPSLLQVLPSAAISYFVYEFMKIVLKVE